mmetsp:Transcript_25071/g.87440  ORF Transcript_25071/g.87440 Transcript_25071/m.87440 type:complete len:338 (-) Transcript_25071:84-1097(-)
MRSSTTGLVWVSPVARGRQQAGALTSLWARVEMTATSPTPVQFSCWKSTRRATLLRRGTSSQPTSPIAQRRGIGLALASTGGRSSSTAPLVRERHIPCCWWAQRVIVTAIPLPAELSSQSSFRKAQLSTPRGSHAPCLTTWARRGLTRTWGRGLPFCMWTRRPAMPSLLQERLKRTTAAATTAAWCTSASSTPHPTCRCRWSPPRRYGRHSLLSTASSDQVSRPSPAVSLGPSLRLWSRTCTERPTTALEVEPVAPRSSSLRPTSRSWKVACTLTATPTAACQAPLNLKLCRTLRETSSTWAWDSLRPDRTRTAASCCRCRLPAKTLTVRRMLAASS